MASKAAAILVSLNLLFFTCVQCSTPPTCPKDTIKFSVCAALLGFLGNVQLGTPCCSIIQGLADLEAAVCLCTALKANVLGINLNIPISLSLVLNHCGKNVPKEFVCS